MEIHCSYDVERGSTQNPVSHGVKTLLRILHDMELRRPLFYFTVPGMLMAGAGVLMGLESLRVFAHGGSLQYAPTLLMVLLTLVGSFMALTGIILHSISRILLECKSELVGESGKKSNSLWYSDGKSARYN